MSVYGNLVLQMNFGKIFQGRLRLIEGDASKRKLAKLFFFPVKQIK